MYHSSQRGMAVTAIILLSVVIVLGVLVGASFTSLGTRSLIANERVAYQALLVAESGVNTFEQRSEALTYSERYYEALDKDSLNAWLARSSLGSLSLGGGASTELEVLSVDQARSSLALQSKSAVADAQGSKKVLIDVAAYRGGRGPRVAAGLTSHVEVRLTGRSGASGQDGLLSSGSASVTSVASSVSLAASTSETPSFTLELADAKYIREGQYLQIEGQSYRVLSRVGNTLSLRPVKPVGFIDRTIAAGKDVALVLAAPSSDVPGRGGSANTFRVSDASSFLMGDSIYAGTFKGKITGIDYDRNTLQVSWSGTPPTPVSPLDEGTPLRRDVLGVASADDIERSGASTISNGQSEDDDVRVPDPNGFDNALFEQTFGMRESDLLKLPDITMLSGNPSGPISGITYLNGDWTSSGAELCGSGILIVTGDVKFNSMCPAGFEGLVYVKGEFDNQGNATIRGAVVVEGRMSTKLSGTGNPYKVEYDPAVLLEVGTLFSPWQFDTIAGTWRQK